MIDRRRELTQDDVKRIADAYHAWRKDEGASHLRYEDIPGFCASATLEEVAAHSHVLPPGRYVGFADVDEDDEPFEEKMARLTMTLEAQFAQSTQLEAAIRENLARLENVR